MRVKPGSWVVAAFLVTFGACASSGGAGNTSTIESAYGALSAEAAVGQFLDAAKRNDYQLMSRLFGTRRGPAVETIGRIEIEQRMYVLASVLQHSSYSLRRVPVGEVDHQIQSDHRDSAQSRAL